MYKTCFLVEPSAANLRIREAVVFMARTEDVKLTREVEEILDRAEASEALATYNSERTRYKMSRLAHAGQLVVPMPRLYARKTYWEELNERERMLHKMRGLYSMDSGVVFAGTSAAVAHGLWVSYDVLGRPVIATSASAHSRSSSTIERVVVDDWDVTMSSGVRVTPLVRTVYDCLRSLPFAEGLVIADSALRSIGARSSDLEDMLAKYAGRRNYEKVRRVASLADGRSESEGESLARASMIELGFALPDLQVEVPDLFDEGSSYRVDFVWEVPTGGVVLGEFDGREKYTNKDMTGGGDALDALIAERRRESRLTLLQVPVMRFGYQEVRNPELFERTLETFGVPRADRGNP